MPPVDAHPRGNLALLLDWIAAMRTGDLPALAELLDPDVVWHGLGGELTCVGRADVLDVLREQVPVSLEIEAIELISSPRHVVLGTRSADLPSPPGVELTGQIFNVFERRRRRFASIRDFARREDALRCAGADPEARWA